MVCLWKIGVCVWWGVLAHLWGLPVEDVVNIHGLPELHVLEKDSGKAPPGCQHPRGRDGAEAGGMHCPL